MRVNFKVSLRPGWRHRQQGQYAPELAKYCESYVYPIQGDNGAAYTVAPYGLKDLCDDRGNPKEFYTLEECHDALVQERSESPFYVSHAEWKTVTFRIFASPGAMFVLYHSVRTPFAEWTRGPATSLLTREQAVVMLGEVDRPSGSFEYREQSEEFREAIDVAWPDFSAPSKDRKKKGR